MKLFLLYRSGCLALQGLLCKLDFPLHVDLKNRNLRYCYKLGNPPTYHISVLPALSPLAGGCVHATCIPVAAGRAKCEDAAQCGCCGIWVLGQMRPWGKKDHMNSNS